MTMATTTVNRHLMNFGMSQYDKRLLFQLSVIQKLTYSTMLFSQKPAAVWNL